MPPHLLARLRHNLGTPVQLALTSPHPLAVGKMGLEYGRRWWEEDERIFGGITTTDLDVARSGTRPTDSSGNGACCSATTTGAPMRRCTTR